MNICKYCGRETLEDDCICLVCKHEMKNYGEPENSSKKPYTSTEKRVIGTVIGAAIGIVLGGWISAVVGIIPWGIALGVVGGLIGYSIGRR